MKMQFLENEGKNKEQQDADVKTKVDPPVTASVNIPYTQLLGGETVAQPH